MVLLFLLATSKVCLRRRFDSSENDCSLLLKPSFEDCCGADTWCMYV